MATIDQKMQDRINKQINAELDSAYLYLSMAGYFDSINLSGFGGWMRGQAKEEVGHAMKLAQYLTERDGRVVLDAIGQPQKDWESPLAAFEAAYGHEQKVTGMIHALVEAAQQAKDHATASMLRWFVDEQVEEEATALGIVEQLKMVQGTPAALFMLNAKLGERS